MTRYKEYCLRALEKNPAIYKSMINPDGSVKPIPRTKNVYKKKTSDTLRARLQGLKKDGWKPSRPKIKKSASKTITKKKKDTRIQNLTILDMPNKPNKKEYNRIWMHNHRALRNIKKLKEQQ